MKVRFLKSFNENFAVRIFIASAVLIAILSFSFTTFFIQHESKSIKDSLVNKGTLLARILAQSTRIGVFSENEKLLEDPMEGVFQQEEVLAVSVFNLRGDLLMTRQKADLIHRAQTTWEVIPNKMEIFEALKKSEMPLVFEHRNRFEFWSPVILGSAYSEEETLVLGEKPLQGKDHVMGFVRVTVDKKILNQRVEALLIKSIFICVAFLLVGSIVTYLVVRGITTPLDKLTEAVRMFGMAGRVEKIPVKKEDQIGRLAKAFNTMSESLKRREEALQASERRLRFLSFELLKAQEKERVRISKELHDELGQALALLKHRIRSIERRLYEGQAGLREECEETNLYIDQIIENVRRLSRDLSPSIIEDLGLSAALRWLAENFIEQYAIRTSFDIENIDHFFSQEEQTNLYRIFQEALTNTGKHAEARHVSLSVTVKKNEGFVSFILKDDGKGFEMDERKKRYSTKRGVGLAAMDERALMLGACLDIESRPGEGTSIKLTIPIEKDESNHGMLSYCAGR